MGHSYPLRILEPYPGNLRKLVIGRFFWQLFMSRIWLFVLDI